MVAFKYFNPFIGIAEEQEMTMRPFKIKETKEIDKNEPIRFWLEEDETGCINVQASVGGEPVTLCFFGEMTGRLQMCPGVPAHFGLDLTGSGRVKTENALFSAIG